MEITFSEQSTLKAEVIAFPITESLKLNEDLKKIDSDNKGSIAKAMKSSGFKGKQGEFLSIIGGIGVFNRIILIGIGKEKEVIESERDIVDLGGKIFSYINKEKIKKASIIINNDHIGGFSPEFVAANIAYGAELKSYRFDKYFTKQKEENKQFFKKLTFSLSSARAASSRYNNVLSKISDGVTFARDVVSEPPNVLYPASYAEKCKELKNLGVKVEVLDEKEMKKLKMGALLGVGQGSASPSKLVIMQWSGADKKDKKPVAFVGKGVTFDTGGISIKPSQGMEDMKYDMGGSASVVGLMKSLAGRKARINAVGVIGLVENMPDGKSQRPSDVVKSMSGQTIEVLNTDAEGRLVLADALWYTQSRFKPKFMVNLATLTGAIVVALGSQYAGLFSNNDELSERLFEAGEQVGEKLWRFPLGKEYDKQIDSKIADMQNIGNDKGAGSITAAQFLQRFVNDTPWAHLDIAGVAWTKKDLAVTPEGATGFGVRLLDRLVFNYYEK